MPGRPGHYVVGIYDSLELDAFPGHASPIVAEVSEAGFRRWTYQIERPYRIRLVAPQGELRRSPAELFPVQTYHTFAPRHFDDRVQSIALARGRVIVSSSHLVIVWHLLVHSLRNWRDLTYLRRAWITLRNALATSL